MTSTSTDQGASSSSASEYSISSNSSTSDGVAQSSRASSVLEIEDPIIHDVLIVGTGPSGLAVAARLKEPLPSAIFTDEEHSRYHWIKKHTGKLAVKNWRNGVVTQAKPKAKKAGPSVLVIDKEGSGGWMAAWNRRFRLLEIEQLRSPMFFHIDPLDRDALVSYASENGRQNELLEIENCVGKERSKHSKKKRMKGPKKFDEPAVDERDRRDYFTPSSKLFRDQCESVIARYGLAETEIREESLQDIDYEYDDFSPTEKVFRVKTDRGLHLAKTVVMAVGPANEPTIPMAPRAVNSMPGEGQCHAMHIRKIPDPNVQRKMKQGKSTSILVIGGGLTAAQIVERCVMKGVSKVYLLMRSELKVKPIDVSLDWVGKFKNHEHATFWSADSDEERFQMILHARMGGSLTPIYHKKMKGHIAAGKLSMHTHTKMASQEWDAETRSWTVTTSPPIEGLPHFDYIYHSTGIQTAISTLPYLQTIREKYPIEDCSGLPCLTEDLMWNEDVPLFFTGKTAGLRLGPAAANLAGARSGAERIVWKIEDLLSEEKPEDDLSYRDIGVNMYGGLPEE
ncbi:hypothetical protein BLS_004405 [Venturia inaequalis]|uniref:L-ornithine N(5)-monooxygenase [NAD(P)H] n=1 Tax=Venturia inaequalis TaxID=5025 RepID=A0A8H3UK48_VENIN|nr:hypothetical protein BLS_004405 [Venturia inaequalis]RDI84730.1 hypothetical protein Vi05172_g5391 [Venturia inaequalis]